MTRIFLIIVLFTQVSFAAEIEQPMILNVNETHIITMQEQSKQHGYVLFVVKYFYDGRMKDQPILLRMKVFDRSNRLVLQSYSPITNDKGVNSVLVGLNPNQNNSYGFCADHLELAFYVNNEPDFYRTRLKFKGCWESEIEQPLSFNVNQSRIISLQVQNEKENNIILQVKYFYDGGLEKQPIWLRVSAFDGSDKLVLQRRVAVKNINGEGLLPVKLDPSNQNAPGFCVDHLKLAFYVENEPAFYETKIDFKKCWEIKDDFRIEYKDIEEFQYIPENIRSYYQALGCKIPQIPDGDEVWGKASDNLPFSGDFSHSGQEDWAVLCSRDGVSAIVIKWGGEAKCENEFAFHKDEDSWEGMGGGVRWFSRHVKPGSDSTIHDEPYITKGVYSEYSCKKGVWIEQ